MQSRGVCGWRVLFGNDILSVEPRDTLTKNASGEGSVHMNIVKMICDLSFAWLLVSGNVNGAGWKILLLIQNPKAEQ
jgi:hypothetical protein